MAGTDSQSLFDTLAGGFGHGVDRPALNSFVANSQTLNGLRTAQTDEAIGNAQKIQDESHARAQLENNLANVVGDDGKPLHNPSQAKLLASEMIGHFGNAKEVLDAYGQAVKNQALSKLGNPDLLNTPDQTAAAQVTTGKLIEPAPLADNFQTPAGVAINAGQTAQGAARTTDTQSQTALRTAQTAAGGFRPQGSVFGLTDPNETAALKRAVDDGRLDPSRLNSRTAHMYAQLEMQSPGTNFNRLHADATLQNNAGFQQRANGLEILPGILQHVTELGKKLDNGSGYSDFRTAGKLQQFLNGETNDPAYAEYMPVRNDALLRLAYLMRGQGASDQASKLENEAFAPTLAPYALDAWLKGQMSVIKPMIDKNNRIVHLGESGQGTQPMGTPPDGGISMPAYPDEATALAAGHKAGDRVTIGGVTGTLQ